MPALILWLALVRHGLIPDFVPAVAPALWNELSPEQRKELSFSSGCGMISVDRNLIRAIKEML